MKKAIKSAKKLNPADERKRIFNRQLRIAGSLRRKGEEPIRNSTYEDFWRQAVNRGLASQRYYERARVAYGDMFRYAGD
jgi:hypothetical protein